MQELADLGEVALLDGDDLRHDGRGAATGGPAKAVRKAL